MTVETSAAGDRTQSAFAVDTPLKANVKLVTADTKVVDKGKVMEFS
jgi:hydrogenase maturation factor